MFYRTILVVLMTAVISVSSIASAVASFRDVLDVPADKSPHLKKFLMVGITMAGERIVSVGQRGHIVYSDDRGKSWNQASVPVSSDLLSVDFPTPMQGWAVGHDGVVLHSADGGATWVKQFDGRAAAQVMVSYYENGRQCTASHKPVDRAQATQPGSAAATSMSE